MSKLLASPFSLRHPSQNSSMLTSPDSSRSRREKKRPCLDKVKLKGFQVKTKMLVVQEALQLIRTNATRVISVNLVEDGLHVLCIDFLVMELLLNQEVFVMGGTHHCRFHKDTSQDV
mmetsp:Transcript_27053/g.49762  ORF Transcript_27053/g.49762 Transcript_27053/m.49762 type:complete len:117 (-) Transcript_27053:420-770(-)